MKERLSNIELLRIIAITMVLMLHFNSHGLHPDVLSDSATLSWASFEGHLIESICIAAVNVFVMISGYFAIRLRVRSVLNLYIRCFMIGMVTYMAYILLSGSDISITALGGRVFAFTHNHWWFVISYLGLMAVSPILNAGCDALSKRNYVYVLAMLSVAMLYFGWYKNLEITNAGYSLIHFIYLYIISRYLRLHVSEQVVFKYRWAWLILFVLLVAALVVFALINPPYAYAYNNPIVVVIAICLLLFFLSIPFYNRFVNWMAASVFSAFLIQESPYFGKMWLYPKYGEMLANDVIGGGLLLFIVYVVGTLVVSILVDKIFVLPIIKNCNRLYEKVFSHNTAV